ncbi:hypothetical protein FRACYDRAFT_248272 [Fragilariopsis cylindrus CCMP1102]|uniref:Cupin 2 conserved barrel domain-containing protein n=1 Tax=Fragilariopsis cylindrus CCMP1102 TaxID=635003 RepID=A0A1E7EV59_9STRA|nr:hypothetical protein FRACYDRAFT_248272 [Fragilariopsis cylindrus CCMP1102]|eukprot:OEU09423.1 hypothetical protein FRACYDRAFT_248272 [Fragilariopsis cylindrus CCMP1102]
MAALPFLITTATVAYAIMFPNERNRESKIATPSSSYTTTTSTSTTKGDAVSTNSFWIGVYCGMSISWLVSYEIKRRRLWDHARLKFLSCLENCTTTSDYYNTTNGDEKVPQRMPLLQKLREPTELISKKTDAVEFYYVIEGEGTYNRNGEKHQISTGFGFIVDPGCCNYSSWNEQGISIGRECFFPLFGSKPNNRHAAIISTE